MIVIILRKVENEGTILKHVWNFIVYVTAGLGGALPPHPHTSLIRGGGGISQCPPMEPDMKHLEQQQLH